MVKLMLFDTIESWDFDSHMRRDRHEIGALMLHLGTLFFRNLATLYEWF